MKRERDIVGRIVRWELWTHIWQLTRIVLELVLVVAGIVYLIKGDLQEATFGLVLSLLIRPRG